MINCSGFKVWPAEVEAMLYAHPAIQEACVIGARDAYRGETVKAVVVLKKNCAKNELAEEIIDWAREKMAAFKVPRVVEFVDAAAQDRHRQDPVARAAGKGKPEMKYLDRFAVAVSSTSGFCPGSK